jgi:hypothetical protein
MTLAQLQANKIDVPELYRMLPHMSAEELDELLSDTLAKDESRQYWRACMAQYKRRHLSPPSH